MAAIHDFLEIFLILFFQKGYGLPFGISDKELEEKCGGIASRDVLFNTSNIIVLPKPTLKILR